MCWECADKKNQQKTHFLRQLFEIKISPVELDHPVYVSKVSILSVDYFSVRKFI